MSEQVTEIFEKYENIARLYRKDNLRQVFFNNANAEEKEIVFDFFQERNKVLEKQIFKARLNILWFIFWFVFQFAALYLIFFNHSISLKISFFLLLFATTMFWLSPFKQKELSEDVADSDAELLTELRQKLGK